MEIDLPKHFRLAKLVSKLSDYKIKVGCVIVRHGSPVVLAYNKVKYSREYSNQWKKSIHAEAYALRLAEKCDVSNGTVYVYREDKNGNIKMARPCKDCIKLLKDRNIKRMIYTVENFPYFNMENL